MRLAGRRVVLGVTGGIAAYKSCILVRRLRELGAEVDVVLTEGAAHFVGAATFEGLSGRPVRTNLWEPGRALDHVRLGQEADLVIVAPATANFLAHAAHGFAEDLLGNVLLASTCPIALAPAMNDSMYAAPATQANLALLASRGIHLIGPAVGPLAEGATERPGRMTEPEAIAVWVERLLRTSSRWREKRVLVTAGPTRESLDPVRVLSNRSSGKMGYRLAEEAWARGAEVTLISGPSGESPPVGCRVIRVESTGELLAAVQSQLPEADVFAMAAAPADYMVQVPEAIKRRRTEGSVSLALEPTDDVLIGTKGHRKRGAVVVGFALETGTALENGRNKLTRKALDLVVVNDALEEGAGFEVDTNRVTILSADGDEVIVPLGSKREVAAAILDAVEGRLGG